MKEVVLFSNKGREIDWYDPVSEEPIVRDGVLIIMHDSGYEYKINLSAIARWEWRDKIEE